MKKILFFALILLIIYMICTTQDVQSDEIAKAIEIQAQESTTESKPAQETAQEIKIYKTTFEKEDPRQDIINYAYKTGGIDFLLTLDGENGKWTTGRKSNIIGANGYYDFGICQLNYKYHKDFINSDNFKDPYKQIDYCFEVWQDAIKKGRLKTTFYAYNVRHKNKVRFENLK